LGLSWRISIKGKTAVFIVARSRLVREALANILSDNERGDIGVAGSAGDLSEAAPYLNTAKPDVVLVSGPFARKNIAAFMHELQQFTSQAKVILLGMEEDQRPFLGAVCAGVVGYLLNDTTPSELIAAVHSVTKGEAVCPPQLASLLFRFVGRLMPPSPMSNHSIPLTRRENELMPLIAQGFTNKEIASRLNISEQTVKNHIHRVLHKTGLKDRLSAARELLAWDTLSFDRKM
jgi:DNA-binding NarL/FixJ family response regulator